MDWTDLMIRLQAGDFDRFMTRNFPQSQNDEKITHWITENVQIYAELEQHLGAIVSRCKELQADIC